MSNALGWAVAQVIDAVEIDDASGAWWFGFRGYGGLRVDCPWQLLLAGRLWRASADHGQQYGHPTRMDLAGEATRLLEGRALEAITVGPETADLTVRFAGDAELRTFADSTGYEVWHLVGPEGQEAVGQGGRVVPLSDEGP